MTTAHPALECRGLRVGYAGAPVVAGLDLTVAPGEVVALLGPSGSGKTTLLSTVAGFLRPQAGEIRIGGELVAGDRRHVPPESRGVGVVFQGAALWPHMSALETVAYPIRRRGVAAAEARRLARELLGRLAIDHLAERRPAEQSGGEQQRVGLGRALAREARLYLFDEPTAHLDAPLRARLQEEIGEQRRRAGAAALYATHDTAEALAIADRVAVLRDGRLVQVGAPSDVYERPADLWSARLTGPSSVLAVRVLGSEGDRVRLDIAGETLAVAAEGPAFRSAGPAMAMIRPDWVSLGGPLKGSVSGVAYRGTHTDLAVATEAGSVGIRVPSTSRARHGDVVSWRLDRVWLLEPGGG
jgi:iron(III) transport system ATP-binding protein